VSEGVYILAGGGTGGHLFPGLAVADALQRADPASRILFLTGDRELDRTVIRKTPYEQFPQPVAPWSSRPWRWVDFWRRWRSSVRAAGRLCDETSVRGVLGLGGYAAGPAIVAARERGIRRAILNPDALPGRANRFLARRTDLVVLQWERSRGHFPGGISCEVWGCPTRREFRRTSAADGRRRFGLDPSRRTILVTGASQGAQTINRAMERVWPIFARERSDWQLLHLTGTADERRTRDVYAAADVAATVAAFTDAMAEAMAAADVVISRAGASTLAELTAVGRPSVLLPYPFHRDMHQRANARVLVDAGAAVLVADERDAGRSAVAILQALRRLVDDQQRVRMAASARALGRPDAAERVAEWLRS
jgi:UDP-N-acetylglucosamine--N-acetylmuramyl-(pentapeptide) pyrophosphoryl-undecaprenol N-acetylglucosamine transferase